MKREEFEEIEEFEDVEEFNDIEDEVEDFEDEEEVEVEVAPKAKKAKKEAKPAKAPKAKKSKGKKAVVGITIAVAVIAVIAVLFVFVVMPMIAGEKVNADYSGTIGATKPTSLTANTPINAEMTPYEMMLAALDNYDNVEYAANICVKGGVSTKIPGLGDVNQGVHSLKVRQGKASDSNVRYFAYSKSMGIANMAEEYYNDGDKIYHRKADKMSKGTDDQGNQRAIIKSWKDTTEYANLEEFIDATSTDFTKIWSYDVNENTVTKESKTGKVTHNEKEGYFTFKVAIDIANEAAIHDYVEVMKYQLTSNMGMEVTSLTFTNLEFEFSVWDNGFIRYLAIHEAYDMNIAMGSMIKINMGIENNYMNEYSFDKNEKIPYDDGAKTQKIQELDFAGLVALF